MIALGRVATCKVSTGMLFIHSGFYLMDASTTMTHLFCIHPVYEN